MATTKPVKGLSYEQAFEELEKIVSTLESNQLSLEDGMALFERGQSLAKHCTTLLEKAELKIRQLTQVDAGSADLVESEDEG